MLPTNEDVNTCKNNLLNAHNMEHCSRILFNLGYSPFNRTTMEDLTKLNVTDLKKEIFDLCQYIYPNDLLIEGESEINTHIFHSIKINKAGELYSILDVAKEKSTQLNNKFLLYKIKEELLNIAQTIEKEAVEELEVEALTENIFASEPNPETLEAIEKELRVAHIFEEEVID